MGPGRIVFCGYQNPGGAFYCLRTDAGAADVKQEPDWRCLQVDGPLDFALIGILADLAGILAEAKISIFVLSTYDTDYLLVKADSLTAAVQALERAGHKVHAEHR